MGLTQFGDDEIQEAKDLSDEKIRWCVQYLTEECTARAVIVWCRWRRERERLVEALNKQDKKLMYVRELYGGQPRQEREDAVTLFSVVEEKHPSDSMYVLVAQQHAGGFGLNLVAATEAVYLSNDFSLGIRLQSEDRCHRPGQEHPVTYIDVLATGPKGQKTIDHTIVKSLREKKSVADFTTAQWRKELSDEMP
jgi:SNF2 family DNA or RNA helicase